MGLKVPVTVSLEHDSYDRFQKLARLESFTVSEAFNGWMRAYIEKYDATHQNVVHRETGPTKICPKCGAEFAERFNKCPGCGAEGV